MKTPSSEKLPVVAGYSVPGPEMCFDVQGAGGSGGNSWGVRYRPTRRFGICHKLMFDIF